jgi:phage regulator Rha-like protein
MSDLVIIVNNEVFTTNKIIANETENSVYSVNKLISTHKEHLEKFGVIRFEIEKPKKNSKGGRPTELYFLNEQQTTLLLTFMRNSETVIDFKVKLVQEFYKMRKTLQNIYSMRKTDIWVETRENQKGNRKIETDTIKKFIEYAKSQGSQSADRYYSNITQMENKALFIVKDKFPNLKDVLTPRQLMNSATCNDIVVMALEDGMEKNMFYKDIYKLAKKRVEVFASVMPKTYVPFIEKNQLEG